MFYWLIKYLFVGPWLRLTCPVTFEGRENYPETGAALLAPNHLSVADWLFLPLVSPRRVTFLAKSEYYTGKGIKGTLSRWFFAGSGQHPIDRTNADTAQAALETGVRILEGGDLLCLFPEGTRSPDGRLYRGKTGAVRVAMAAGVPIVPVGLIGTDRFLRGSSPWPHPTRIRVRFGEPITPEAWAGREGDHAAAREVTDEIMRRIDALTGQPYVADTYGAQEKKRQEALARTGHNLLDRPATD